MVDAEVVQRRLEKLDEYLRILRRLARYTQDEFISDPERYGSAERFLELSIKLIADLGNHVVASESLGRVQATADIPRILQDNKIVGPELAETWTQMIGFRNVLAHEYMEIDRSQVYRILTSRLTDLEALRRVFVGLL